MSLFHDISDAELEIMNILWRESPQTSQSLIRALEEKNWSDSTVKTLLSRLVKKGALGYETEGNRNIYRPLVSAQEYGAWKGSQLGKLLRGGAALATALHFIKDSGLSAQDLEELKAFLKEESHE